LRWRKRLAKSSPKADCRVQNGCAASPVTGAYDMIHGMNRSDTVTVFSFRAFDLDSREMQVASGKATRDAIARFSLAELVPGTAEDVPRRALDAQGRYRRVATGWGELA
jgi:hypothetical protein